MRYIVADRVIDLGTMDVDANCRVDGPLPDDVEHTECVEVAAELWQSHGIANTGDRGPFACYGRTTVQTKIEREHYTSLC